MGFGLRSTFNSAIATGGTAFRTAPRREETEMLDANTSRIYDS